MRVIIFILILAVVAALIAIGTGFIDITQTRDAQAPQITTGNGITASRGQTPAFEVETGSVTVGTQSTNVTVPAVRVNPPNNQADNSAELATNTAN